MNDPRTPERNGDELLVAQLRDTFEALAVAYEPRSLRTDLWARGRREGRSTRLQLVAASVVLLALLGGTFAWGRGAPVGPAGVPDGGALPQVVHVPASDQVRRMVDDGQVSRSLDVGPLSVTVVLEDRYVLGVGARDGEHVLLDLPDLDPATATTSQAVSLSADGHFLAWPYVDPRDPDGESSGVKVVDLTDGGVTGFRATGPGRLPVRVRATTWSADGGRLGFAGTEYVPLEGTEGASVVGVLDPTSTDPVEAVGLETGWLSSVAVADDGTLHVVSNEEGHLRLDPGAQEPVLVGPLPDEGDEPLGAALSPGSARLAVGGHSANDFGSWELPTEAGGSTPRARAWPVGDHDTAMPLTSVRGWTPQGGVLGLLEAADEGLALHRLAPDGQVRSLVEVRQVERTFGEAALGVASDLGDVESARFPAPGWTRHPLRPLGIALAVLAGLAGLVVLVRAVERARVRRGRRDEPMPLGIRDMNEHSFVLDSTRAFLARRPSGRLVGRGARTLGLLALTGALAATVAPMQPRPDGPVVTDGALPVRVHAPTDWVAMNPQAAALEKDAPPLSVLVQGDFSARVGVSRSDGAHAFFAPATDWMEHTELTPRLSPDGTRLADLWVELGEETGATRAGLAVTDLRTGEVKRMSLRGPNDRPVRIKQVSWSADATHLAWFGDEAVQWDRRGDGDSASTGPRRVVGVSRADDLQPTSWQVDTGDGTGAVAAAPDGTGHLLAGRRLWTFRSASPTAALQARTVAAEAMEWSGAAVSGDGRTLAVGLDALGTSAYASGLRLLDLTRDDSRMRPLAWRERDPMVLTHALGFTPAGRLVVAGQSAGSRFDGDQVSKVAVVDAEALRGDGTGAEPRIVTEVETSTPGAVSVATDLADRDPVAFAPPRWPTSVERKILAGFLGAALALSLVGELRRWQRTRRGRTALRTRTT